MANDSSSTTNMSSRKLRKRPLIATIDSAADTNISAFFPPSKSSNSGNSETLEQSLKCSVCLQLFDEPHSTVCGHSFCRNCITKSLSFKRKCPQCGYAIEDVKKQVFLNYTLASVAHRFKDAERHERNFVLDVPSSSKIRSTTGMFAKCLTDPNVDLPTLSRMISLLQRKKTRLENEDVQMKSALLREFVDEMISKRQIQADRLGAEIQILKNDRDKITQKISIGDKSQRLVPQSLGSSDSVSASTSVMTRLRRQNSQERVVDGSNSRSKREKSVTGIKEECEINPDMEISAEEGENFSAAQILLKRRQRMNAHFEDLEKTYFSGRSRETLGIQDNTRGESDLENFCDVLCKMTQYNSVRRLASLNYSVEFGQGLSIVSSIEFDKDGEYFVVAGVTKKIKLYDYNSVSGDKVDIHYPMGEMECSSKISCVSWNPYTKNLLASSDYEGTVQLWDTYAMKGSQRFQEHEKRCWSVNFSNADPKLLASGSDDAKVKIWDVNQEQSVQTISAGVNVCCVHFNPSSRHHIAFGSADHCVHYYDIRNGRKPVAVFKGHKKAVSYVKFCNPVEIVSASTDSNLRIWNVQNGECVRTLKGHQNEKNFVGLATADDFISCGSENNNLYVYYKELCRPLIAYNFGTESLAPLLGCGEAGSRSSSAASNLSGGVTSSRAARDSTATAAESNDFVSAVCWKKA